MKGIITEYNEYCIFCGRPVEATHHLIGGANRKKAEADGLKFRAVITATTWDRPRSGSTATPWLRKCQK